MVLPLPHDISGEPTTVAASKNLQPTQEAKAAFRAEYETNMRNGRTAGADLCWVVLRPACHLTYIFYLISATTKFGHAGPCPSTVFLNAE
jgi:hypothetical protein